MRLKSVYISEYKNLKDFFLEFDGESFIDVFVGKNGTGKSNFFEALIEIFRHIDKSRRRLETHDFDYEIKYEISGNETTVVWKNEKLFINGTERRTTGGSTIEVPDNILIYYSGHNLTVDDLIEEYEKAFVTRIRRAGTGGSRFFIGVGPEYKELLFAVIMLQADTNTAKQYICKKLGFNIAPPKVDIFLKRPHFADARFRALEVDAISRFDPRTRFWGAEGTVKEFLDKLWNCIKGEFQYNDIYSQEEDSYSIPIDAELFQRIFADVSVPDVFRQFDNLKTLGMLEDIQIFSTLTEGIESDFYGFSDGQFQSVYIYSIIELFKDKNCITLLDEPDSFLHPEWQHEFLKQVAEISTTEAQNNHILMASHSAVTLIPHGTQKIRFFDTKNNLATCYDLPKSVAIKQLSSSFIKYSEQEQLLSIINAMQIEKKPVLFTEGSSDPIILKEAWNRLYDDEMPFIPFYAFGCGYIKALLTDPSIRKEMLKLPIFGLFDFDKAYDQWNSLDGEVLETDPHKGMIKKWSKDSSYAIMLPVPSIPDIEGQVIKNAETKETYEADSCCAIEHLFYGLTATNQYFKTESIMGGGKKIVFASSRRKVGFAQNVVPIIRDEKFEVFRPMFDFIKGKISEHGTT